MTNTGPLDTPSPPASYSGPLVALPERIDDETALPASVTRKKPVEELAVPGGRPVALLAIPEYPHAQDMVRLAWALRREGIYEPVVLCIYLSYVRRRPIREALDRAGVRWFDLDAPAEEPTASRRQWLARRGPVFWTLVLLLSPLLLVAGLGFLVLRYGLPGRVRRALHRRRDAILEAVRNDRGIVQFITAYRARRQELRSARKAMAHLKPAVILAAEDNVETPSPAIVRAGRDAGVPTVVVPFTLSNADEFKESLADSEERSLKGWLNRLVAWRYPQWAVEHRQRRFLRLPGYKALALEWLGLAPPRPWVPNDGAWAALAVESPAMLQRYLTMGLPPGRLHLTGAISDDVLAAGRSAAPLRRTLCAELGLASERPLLVCALPPDQTGGRRAHCEFSAYQDLVAFFIRSIQGLGDFQAVVSLHPRTSPGIRSLIESLGGKVSSRPTLELVPLCDLYLASVSATIRWAIACGVPVLNYDVYKYRYDDYAGVGGVLNVETGEAYLAALKRLTSNPQYLAEVSARQEACASSWGHRDGQSVRRFVALMDALTNRPGAETGTPGRRAA
jgi:hypothetical protein